MHSIEHCKQNCERAEGEKKAIDDVNSTHIDGHCGACTYATSCLSTFA